MLLSHNKWMNERSMRRCVLGVIARGQWPDWLKKYAACWNSRVPVNFRVSGINSRDVESGAVSLAFVCLVDFYLILITVKRNACNFFARLNYFAEICHRILIITCMFYEKMSLF